MDIYRKVLYGFHSFWLAITPKVTVKQMSGPVWYQHTLPIIASTLYVLLVFFGPKIQKKYQFLKGNPKLVRKISVYWNFFLSIYSGITVTFFITDTLVIMDRDWNYSIFQVFCAEDCLYFQDGMPGIFWGWMFGMSKYFELFDTVLLVIKEKPLMFLHYWHHFSVLVYTWYAEMATLSLGTMFVTINAGVHTIMYFYYALAALRQKWVFKFAPIITFIQTSQMVVGLIGTGIWITAYVKWGIKCCCSNYKIIVPMTAFIYFSYLVLFLQFAYRRYIAPKPKKSKKDKDKKK